MIHRIIIGHYLVRERVSYISGGSIKIILKTSFIIITPPPTDRQSLADCPMARFLSLSDSFPSQHCQPPSLPSSTWRQILCSDDDDDDDDGDGDGDDDIGGDGADEEGAHHHHHNEWRFWKIFVGLYV